MESNNRETNLIQFSLSEKEVRENFLDFIIKGDSTPIDVACESTIVQITKQYYPVRCFYVTYSADWDATSIWEHKEEYTEYQKKIVYIDYRGQERSSSGWDYEVRNGKSTQHYRKPMEKTIPVKKTKTVVDNVEETYGGISDERFFLPVFIPSDTSQNEFAKWIAKQVTPSKYGIGQIAEECQVQELQGAEDYAKKIAASHAQDRAYSQCKGQVPGSRYEDFSVSNFQAKYKMDIVLVPVYYITYSYKGASFECWRGGTSEETWYSHSKPQDSAIAEQDQQAKIMIEGIKSKRLKVGLIVFLGLPVAVCIILLMMLEISINGGSLVWLWAGLAAIILCEMKCFNQFKKLNQEIGFQETVRLNIKRDLISMRKAIAEIVKRDDLNEEQQRAAIRDVLNGNFQR